MMRWRMIARGFLFAAILLAVTLALMPQPPHLPTDVLSDKVQHMMAFATLSALAAWSYPGEPLLRIGERLSFLGALIEVLQAIPSLHRDCDIRDWMADTVAIAVVLLLVASRRAWRRERAVAP